MGVGPTHKIPPAALWLGLFGLVPFVAAAGVSLHDGVGDPTLALRSLAAYGAVILSFLGGIHWGVALTRGRSQDASSQTFWYVLSIVPSLAAWGALLMSPVPGLLVLLLSFLAMATFDTLAARAGQLPDWYPKLRWLLTAIV